MLCCSLNSVQKYSIHNLDVPVEVFYATLVKIYI